MKSPVPCPNCQSRNLYKSRSPLGGGGHHAPNYLVGLGRWYRAGRFDVVLCRDCGLTRLFAEEEAREKLEDSKSWERL
jgi:DNA-directed RNA polymerase subunit RPC12/RpoP